jgi:hypothetical protein
VDHLRRGIFPELKSSVQSRLTPVTRKNLNSDLVLTSPDGSAATRSTLQQLRLWVLPIGAPAPRPVEKRALIVAVVLAIIAWVVAMLLRNQPINVWIDQISVFRRSMEYFSHPYQLNPFVYPPWVLLLIAPFELLPFSPFLSWGIGTALAW